MTLCSNLKPCPCRVKFLLRTFPDPLGPLRVLRLLRRNVFNYVALHSTSWSFDAILLFDPRHWALLVNWQKNVMPWTLVATAAQVFALSFSRHVSFSSQFSNLSFTHLSRTSSDSLFSDTSDLFLFLGWVALPWQIQWPWPSTVFDSSHPLCCQGWVLSLAVSLMGTWVTSLTFGYKVLWSPLPDRFFCSTWAIYCLLYLFLCSAVPPFPGAPLHSAAPSDLHPSTFHPYCLPLWGPFLQSYHDVLSIRIFFTSPRLLIMSCIVWCGLRSKPWITSMLLILCCSPLRATT